MLDELLAHGFSNVELVSEGNVGQTYRGIEKETGKPVFIKIIYGTYDNNFEKVYNMEIKNLLKIRHPAILPIYKTFYCHFEDKKDYAVFVSEEVSKGSLHDVYRKDPSILTPTIRNNIYTGLASAFLMLESSEIYHLNLNPKNILLDDEYKPHITHYGLATIAAHYGAPIIKDNEYPAYISPEITAQEIRGTQCDTFSFGILGIQLGFDVDLYQKEQKFAYDILNRDQDPPNRKLIEYIRNVSLLNFRNRPSFEIISVRLVRGTFYFDGCNIDETRKYIDTLIDPDKVSDIPNKTLFTNDCEMQRKFFEFYGRSTAIFSEDDILEERKELINLLNTNPEQFHKKLLLGIAKKQDNEFPFLYGLLLWNGLSVSQNRQLALYYMVLAIKNKGGIKMSDHSNVLKKMSEESADGKFLLGYYVYKNVGKEEGLEIIKQASEAGSNEAEFFYLYLKKPVIRDQENKIIRKQLAAVETGRKSAFAAYYFGTIYEYGLYGCTVNLDIAKAYYSLAASKYHIKAMSHYAALIGRTNRELALKYLEIGAMHYNTSALIGLARHVNNFEESERFLRKASFEKGSRRGFVLYAKLLREAGRLLKNDYLYRMINNGYFKGADADGLYEIGRIFYYGLGGSRDFQRAIDAFLQIFQLPRPSFLRGHEAFEFFSDHSYIPIFKFLMGMCLKTGNGAPMDKERGVQIIKEVAEKVTDGKDVANAARLELIDMYDSVPKMAYKTARRFLPQGNPGVVFRLACFLHEGRGVKADVPKAVEYFKVLADAGFPNASARLHYIDDAANERRTHPELASMAESGNGEAALLWARAIFVDGLPCLPEEIAEGERALACLRKASATSTKCALELAWILSNSRVPDMTTKQYTGDCAEALSLYLRLASAGSCEAARCAALLVWEGRGAVQYPLRVFELLQLASDGGDAAASLLLAKACLLSYGTDDVERGLQIIAQAKEAAAAKYLSGLSKFLSLGVVTDRAEGLKLIAAAAAEGHPEAVAFIGIASMYRFDGVDSLGLSDTAEYVKRAARAGVAIAQYHAALGYMHGLYGHEGRPLFESALRLLESSSHSIEDAQLKLARMYAYGLAVEKDEKRAFELASDLYRRGNKHAGVLLGSFYLAGIGCEKNQEEAEKLFHIGMVAKCARAFTQMGAIKFRQNSEEALSLFQEADKLGDPDAQFFIGLCTYNGCCGAKKDEESAVDYFAKAASRTFLNGPLLEYIAPGDDETMAFKTLKELSSSNDVICGLVHRMLRYGNGCLVNLKEMKNYALLIE